MPAPSDNAGSRRQFPFESGSGLGRLGVEIAGGSLKTWRCDNALLRYGSRRRAETASERYAVTQKITAAAIPMSSHLVQRPAAPTDGLTDPDFAEEPED
jgi:hypothetical protein